MSLSGRMTYILSLFISRSVCLLGSYRVLVTETRPANSHLGGDGQTREVYKLARVLLVFCMGLVCCGGISQEVF